MRMNSGFLTLALGSTLLVVSAVQASAGGDRVIELRDDCSNAPDSGFPTCTIPGSTDLEEFREEIRDHEFDGHWKYNPGGVSVQGSTVDVDEGGKVVLINKGGQLHTFTRVAAFGGGFLPTINVGSPVSAPCTDWCANAVPVTECSRGFQADGITPIPRGPGPNSFFLNPFPSPSVVLQTGPGTNLPAGTYKYQCCLHPWMRLNLVVKKK